jgi:hypothetical protein
MREADMGAKLDELRGVCQPAEPADV